MGSAQLFVRTRIRLLPCRPQSKPTLPVRGRSQVLPPQQRPHIGLRHRLLCSGAVRVRAVLRCPQVEYPGLGHRNVRRDLLPCGILRPALSHRRPVRRGVQAAKHHKSGNLGNNRLPMRCLPRRKFHNACCRLSLSIRGIHRRATGIRRFPCGATPPTRNTFFRCRRNDKLGNLPSSQYVTISLRWAENLLERFVSCGSRQHAGRMFHRKNGAKAHVRRLSH